MSYKKIMLLTLGCTSIFYTRAMEEDGKKNNSQSSLERLVSGVQKDIREISTALNEIQRLEQQRKEKKEAYEKYEADNAACFEGVRLDLVQYMEKNKNGQLTKEVVEGIMQKLKQYAIEQKNAAQLINLKKT